jgi:uracil-DNA glycosylase family protein
LSRITGDNPPVVPRPRQPSLAESLVPDEPSLEALRSAASTCQACDLWSRATQTVFGEGEPEAEIVLVGEQPGDREDKEGQPFVGPAGRVLDEALEAAGIDRRLAYVTNVVKHFKWEPRGKVRLHKTPNAAEVSACRPWLEAELRVLRPRVLVCLGATAAKALLGSSFKVSQERGRFVDSELAPRVLATVHPSSILRADDAARDEAMAALVADLRVAATALAD